MQKIGVPIPKTIKISHESEISNIYKIELPFIAKPIKRNDRVSDIFRNFICYNSKQIETLKIIIKKNLSHDCAFIVSELIPGKDHCIYATTILAYEGKVINFWTGRKLTQYPDAFGVFATAENIKNDLVEKQSFDFVRHIKWTGIIEPEFKFDFRDGKFKLMEANLRPMMWHRVGTLSRVNLNLDFIKHNEYEEPKYSNQSNDKVLLIFALHEIYNVLKGRSNAKRLIAKIKKADVIGFSVFNKRDLKPFIVSIF